MSNQLIKPGSWFDKFRRARKQSDYSYSIVGSALPTSHLGRPTLRQMHAMAKRFVRDGEIHNAVEMLRLAARPKQLCIYFPSEPTNGHT